MKATVFRYAVYISGWNWKLLGRNFLNFLIPPSPTHYLGFAPV